MAHDGHYAAKIVVLALAAALTLCAALDAARAETQSVIDPVEAPEAQKPPAPAVKKAPRPEASAKRERQRAEEESRKRAAAERAQAAEAEAERQRAAQQAQRAKAAREAAARAQAARVAKARAAAAQKEAARKEALRQAAAREAAARQAAAKEAARREAAARETAAREAAARETAAREAAARAAAARETEAREAALREAAAREAAAKEAAAREAALREAAAKEAAAREAAVREAAAREAAAREAAAREAAGRLAAARAAAAPDARAQPRPWPVFRDCADCPEVVWLPKGEMLLGQQDAAGGPRYVARMSYPLAVGRFKVSFAEWDACIADGGCRRRPDDAGWGRGRQPVINVSWEDAQQYAAWLSRRTSKRYRLLTGAEWEYAARSGPDVHDMQGGVSEWVENCYQYRDARNGGKMWTLECTNQMVRGGAAQGAASMTRVSRSFAPFNYYDSRIGFRVARTE